MARNVKAHRRRFGSVRQLASGRFQVRYTGPDGFMRPADRTFADKTEAQQWLSLIEADILKGDWIDPDAGQVDFIEYGDAWIDERPELRPKTIQLYRYLFRRHIAPAFRGRAIAQIREPQVRRWRKSLIDAGVSPVTVAKAYRLLKAIMNTAVDDGMIRRNPCRIKGAGQERSPERPVLTVPQVFALADAITPRYRGLILLAVFGSVRWGELAALRRTDIDLGQCTVAITRTLTEIRGGGKYAFGPPKSDAGRRIVTFPELIKPDLAQHLARFVQPEPDALVFTAPTGTPLRHGNFRRSHWLPALAAAGLNGIHFHDLRHTGNNLVANAGAGLRELMERMGHSTTRAALVYLHPTNERHRTLADAVGVAARKELQTNGSRPAGGTRTSGTGMARKRGKSS